MRDVNCGVFEHPFILSSTLSISANMFSTKLSFKLPNISHFTRVTKFFLHFFK
jgi:hypothetical protein